VKRWKETSELFAGIARLPGSGRRAALATVVHIAGSAYRRPGAKFLVEEGGGTLGSISGGCLEADVREAALAVIREAAPRRLRYDTGEDDRAVWGLGLGCRGTVDLFVQTATDPNTREAIERARELLEADRPFALATVVGGPRGVGAMLVVSEDGAAGGSTADAEMDRAIAREGGARIRARESRLQTVGDAEIFIEVLAPPPRLLLFGAGDDTRPICAYAADVGFRVTVVDHREAFLSAERFPGAAGRALLRPEDGVTTLPVGPGAYAVVMSHSFAHDREWARHLLAAGAPHVGLLGPRARTEEILRQIGAEGDERVFGPVGLDLGAEGPEQVALAVVAELLATHTSREPAHLRQKQGAIHAT
jgi:xanthine/CO dehydrogenase XdhC/CoxF family maturation factor